MAAWHRGSTTVWPLASCSMFVQPLLSHLLTWVFSVLLIPWIKLDRIDWAGSEPNLWDVLCQGYQLLIATDCILGLTVCLEDVLWERVSRCPWTHPGPIAQGAVSWASLTVKRSSSGVCGLQQSFLAETSKWKRVLEGSGSLLQVQLCGLLHSLAWVATEHKRKQGLCPHHLEVMDDGRGRVESGGD